MRLYTKCKNCKSEINFKTTASDRFVLARKRGERIDLNCTSCGTGKQYHVNDIKAEESNIMSLFALFIFLGGTIGLFIYLWPYFFRTSYIYAVSGLIGVLTIPFLIYQAISSTQAHRVNYFNSKQFG